MLSQVGHMMVGVADSIMVGHLGAAPLASVSLAMGVYAVLMLFGIGVSYGMTPLVAESDGAGNKLGAASVLKHALIINGGVGVIMVTISLLGPYIFRLLNQEEEVLIGAIPFFVIVGIGSLPLMIFQTFRQFTEGLSYTRQAMWISVSGNIFNVLLNYILIYGAFGVTPLGMFGAAWATLVTRVLMAFAMWAYVRFHPRFATHMASWGMITLTRSVFIRLLGLGLPSGLQFVFEIGAFSAAAVMTGWLGVLPLAAHQIALNLSAITYMAATGLSAAATIRIGNQLGKRDYVTLKQAGNSIFWMVGVLMTIFGLLFILLRDFLPTLYVEDMQVILMASQVLVIVAIYQISDGVQAVGLGVLRGLSDVRIPTYVTLFAYWVVAIPCSYLLGVHFKYGLAGIWIGLLLGLSLAAVMHVIRFKYFMRTVFNSKSIGSK